jgi:hypothetical protein
MAPINELVSENAQLRYILDRLNSIPQTPREGDDMQPPAYHTVVDPTASISNMHNPYDAEEENEDETPEITINAATQVRGHGNIISIAQLDSVRIANLIAVMLSGGKLADPANSEAGHTLPSLASLASEPKPSRHYPKINITVNCGATVTGDRNIVGPGLGDIARQMQVAQREKAAQQQQQQATQIQIHPPMSTAPTKEGLSQAQISIARHHELYATPPMSRSASLQSDGSRGKRKAEDNIEGSGKRRC